MHTLPSIGIDVGKRELVARLRCSNGITEPPAAFPNTSLGLQKLLVYLRNQNIAQSTSILLESTGPYHWQAARTLTDHGYAARIVNPLHTKQMTRFSISKRKTDPVDAGHLAFLASQGYGYPFVETEELAYRKALVRHYWKLWDAARVHEHHEAYLREHRQSTRCGISAFILKKCETAKKEIIREFSAGNDLRYLDSIPGVTPLLGATILAELQPIDRFTRIEQIVAFSGLDPSVKQSGGKTAHHGRLSKRGSRRLRQALYFAAFGAFAHKTFHPLYASFKARGLHHTVILCILARKVLRIAVTLLRKRCMFDPRLIRP